jgi:GTP cyclohydrolase I
MLEGRINLDHMNHLTDALQIPDTQSERDERHLAIQRVGVKGVRYPLTLLVAGQRQETIGTWQLDVALPADQKGTHMSRFVAWLEGLTGEGAPVLGADEMALQLTRMLDLLNAREGRIEVRFGFFIRKRAPVSGLSSLLDHQGAMIAERISGHTSVWLEVGVAVKSLCPCSKEISDYGAHNQRSLVTLRAETRSRRSAGDAIAWHELVRYAEESASSEIWPMLKRADEKWITERAYENPKFVEDLVRDVALRLNADQRVGAYRVDVENFESIHNHSAWARIDRPWPIGN